MKDLLFLAHRIPYPPDKGEKIRAWHMLRELEKSWRLHVGCLIDDPADLAHVATLAGHCAELMAVPIDRRRQRAAAVLRARPGRSLSEGYFHHPRLAAWVDAKLAGGIDRAFVYCSAMAPYLLRHPEVVTVLDMVDVDSEKWCDYAARSLGPKALVWAREARTLLALERRAAARFAKTLLVSEPECARFAELAPEARQLQAVENGVDLARFDAPAGADPYPAGERRIVFTGAMDYWPNIDAVTWFATDILPRIAVAGVVFSIVGSNPAPAVTRLAGPRVRVTGRVADTHPYLAHAEVAVAPLRLARGVQNKVLEAMACARPVVATAAAAQGIRAVPGRDLLVADTEDAFAAHVAALLEGRRPDVGSAGRRAMDGYGWDAALAPLADIFSRQP